MNHGVLPLKRKWHHHSSLRLGAVAVSYQPFSLDYSKQYPDQNADGWPEECTIYSQTEVCQDEDNALYDRVWLRQWTDFISGQSQGPYDVEDSIRAVCVYGPRQDAPHRGYPVWLDRQPGMDFFDSAIALMQQTRCALSIVSPWLPAFEEAPGGIMPAVPSTWPATAPGHNHVGDGLQLVNGEPAISDKSWQGTDWGTGGRCFWDRAAFNALMEIPGAGAFILMPYDGSIRCLQTQIVYRLQILIRLYQRQLAQFAGIKPAL